MSMSVLISTPKGITYETLVSHSRTSTVQPCLLVSMAGSHKGSRRQLLCIETEADIARTVLALWNGARNGFRGEAVR